jgi:hypothetical protein
MSMIYSCNLCGTAVAANQFSSMTGGYCSLCAQKLQQQAYQGYQKTEVKPEKEVFGERVDTPKKLIGGS